MYYRTWVIVYEKDEGKIVTLSVSVYMSYDDDVQSEMWIWQDSGR